MQYMGSLRTQWWSGWFMLYVMNRRHLHREIDFQNNKCRTLSSSPNDAEVIFPDTEPDWIFSCYLKESLNSETCVPELRSICTL